MSLGIIPRRSVVAGFQSFPKVVAVIFILLRMLTLTAGSAEVTSSLPDETTTPERLELSTEQRIDLFRRQMQHTERMKELQNEQLVLENVRFDKEEKAKQAEHERNREREDAEFKQELLITALTVGGMAISTVVTICYGGPVRLGGSAIETAKDWAKLIMKRF